MKLIKVFKEIISEQVPPIKIQQSGDYVNINGQNYKLQVYKLGGWKDVGIDKLNPRNDGGYDITASLGIFSQTDVVPSDTIRHIQNYIGKPEITLGGKVPKKLVKM